ncbi:N-acetylmuramoyl-L-alanine amidase [Blautia stercoris]|uniref:N-acetylmuramoyl-L-alanine amidase n=1 Tax=Blautia stercoris TaxID=871664 RepID=A0ABR7P8E3_9FIRM|nr:N-acetylmuramoyl-L-alanine amidase [Blautia stercoris]MBC8627670.1 N-acetylmuramoyl-L-alanine amidase [Blautia stercoris]
MKKATKKWIAYLLTLTMLLSVATPVFGAEPEDSVPETVQTQEAVQSTEKSADEISQEQVSEEQNSEAQSTNEQDTEEQNSKTSDLEGTNSEETNSEEMNSEEMNSRDAVSEVAFNYVVTQDDGINQSVIMSFGDETTVIESAVLTYRDGGEVKTAESDTVAENFAVFLLPIAQDGVERVWESAVVRITGIEYTVSLQDSEGMTQTEVSEETASEVLQDTEESLDEETANLVEDSVISTKGDGITGEEIADSIEKSIELVPDADVAAQISTFSMESVGRAVQKYVIVLDPGHGGTDSGAENQNGISSESESKLTLKIANYVKQELEKSSQFVVYMTRTDDSYVGLSERVNYAASKNADILVSLHLNSADSKTANGAEILVPRTGRYNSKVAENAGQLAQDILKKLVSLGLYNRGLVYRDSASGTKYPDGSTADYYAIVRQGLQAGIPSIIVEHAFISSTVDAKFLDSEADLQKIGRADAEGIAQYFGVTLSNSSNNNSNSNSGDSDKNGWVKENRNWYYYKSNAKQTGWQKVDGKWYYLKANGVMQTYWYLENGKYYFLGANGSVRTGWQNIWGKWYYFDSDGVMQTGWQKIKGVWYYLGGSSDGAMKTGWQKINGKWYYLNANGVMQTYWYLENGKYYFLGANGSVRTGWQNIWGKYYHFDSDGVMQTGWQKIDGAWYYFGNEKNGAMQVGWQIVDHEYYYIVDSGVMQTYWRKIDGNYYFFGANGSMRTGWQKIWGKWYYLDENGVMQTGWQKIKGVWYYFGGASDGAMKTGWQTINGKTYYFDSEGAMATGTVTISGKKYEFNSSGVLKEETKNEGLYQITGKSSVTVSQMVKYYNKYSSIAYPSAALTKGGAADIETFCKIIKEEADAENMKADVVFIQAMLETGYLKFGGDVKISQFNFAGLGATGNGVAGNSFKDVRTGIRAQVQHLKAYANKEALKNTCVDVRFSYVTRGSAPYVEWLGIQENPNGGGWAASKNYGNDLLGLINKLKAI